MGVWGVRQGVGGVWGGRGGGACLPYHIHIILISTRFIKCPGGGKAARRWPMRGSDAQERCVRWCYIGPSLSCPL